MLLTSVVCAARTHECSERDIDGSTGALVCDAVPKCVSADLQVGLFWHSDKQNLLAHVSVIREMQLNVPMRHPFGRETDAGKI
jgi:hypothetical protein